MKTHYFNLACAVGNKVVVLVGLPSVSPYTDTSLDDMDPFEVYKYLCISLVDQAPVLTQRDKEFLLTNLHGRLFPAMLMFNNDCTRFVSAYDASNVSVEQLVAAGFMLEQKTTSSAELSACIKDLLVGGRAFQLYFDAAEVTYNNAFEQVIRVGALLAEPV